MDYGAMIKEAWATTWRYRFLWLLGLFAGGASGFVGWRGIPGDQGFRMEGPPFGGPHGRAVSRGMPSGEALGQAGQWIAAHTGLLVGAGVLLGVLGVAWLVVSLIARGGMAEATVDLATGRPATLGRAWRTGLHLFWRYAGLYLMVFGAAAVVGLAVSGLVALLVAGVRAGGGARIVAALLGVAIGAPLAVAGIAAAVGLSIVMAYAQRSIFAEDAGPVTALRSGWGLLRARPGESLLTWLISLGLGLAGGLAVTLALLVAVAFLGVVGVAIWSVGVAALTVGYVTLGVAAVLALAAVVGAIANTFFWNLWTQAYVRLRGTPATPQAVI